VKDYLTENVDYSLDRENLDGLRLFFRYGAELQLFTRIPELEFLQPADEIAGIARNRAEPP